MSLLSGQWGSLYCNIFAQAYVTPVYDVTTDVTDNHFFQTNVDEHTGDAIRSLFTGFNQQATEASEDFWTVYLLGGYQYTIDRDEDPETEAPNVFAGVTDVQNGMGSIVFMETNGPKECNLTGSFCIIADTAAHEIGHQANADHGEGGIMDGLSNSFSPTSLSSIRNSTHP